MQIYRLQSYIFTGAVNAPVEIAEEIYHQSMTAIPGRRWVMASLVFAALALVVPSVVFGTLGLVAGPVAVAKGGGWWGTAGVPASFAAAVLSAYLEAWL